LPVDFWGLGSNLVYGTRQTIESRCLAKSEKPHAVFWKQLAKKHSRRRLFLKESD